MFSQAEKAHGMCSIGLFYNYIYLQTFSTVLMKKSSRRYSRAMSWVRGKYSQQLFIDEITILEGIIMRHVGSRVIYDAKYI